MKGKRVYIDTNVFAYVSLKHPDYYSGCYNVLSMLVLKKFKGYISYFVLFELFGVLSRFNPKVAVTEFI